MYPLPKTISRLVKLSAAIAASAGVLVFCVAVPWPSKAVAADYPQCDPAMFQDRVWQSSDATNNLISLSMVDKTNFEDFKKNFGANVVIPIDGVPTDFGATYASFDSVRRTVSEKHSLSLSTTDARQLTAYRLTDNGTKAYQTCIKAQFEAVGPHIIFDSTTETQVTGRVRWTTDPATNPKTLVLTRYIDGKVVDNINRKIYPNGTVVFSYPRNPRSTMSITAQISALADARVIPASPLVLKPAPSPTPRVFYPALGNYPQEVVRTNAHETKYLLIRGEWWRGGMNGGTMFAGNSEGTRIYCAPAPTEWNVGLHFDSTDRYIRVPPRTTAWVFLWGATDGNGARNSSDNRVRIEVSDSVPSGSPVSTAICD